METVYSDPAAGFLLACVAGVLLALFYDVFRISRALLHPRRRSVFLQDLLFFSVSAVVTFLVSLATNSGILRFYLLAGEGLGMCAYFLTLGEITIRLASLLLRILRAVDTFWKRRIFSPVCQFFTRIFKQVGQKIQKSRECAQKSHSSQKKP